jgi:putative selenium metabolism hydrolase
VPTHRDQTVGADSSERSADEQLVAFARELVRTPSLSEHERAVGERLARELTALGYEEVALDVYGNVTARYGPEPAALLFNGHIDHVPPSDMVFPYEAEIVDGSRWGREGPVLRGRGSCDMKANVAAGAYAVRYLPAGLQLTRGYRFVADVREEIDAEEGLPHVLRNAQLADVAISGESTSLDVAIGHRGKVQFDIVVAGRSSHTSRPYDGVNAVYQARPIIEAIEAYAAQLPHDERYGPATAAVIHVESSPDPSVAVVPSRCTIRMDRRFIPGETPDSVAHEIHELVAGTCARDGIDATVEQVGVYPLMATDADDPLVAHGVAAVEDVTGRRPSVTTWDFGVSATFMSAAGIPSIGIGPGDERYAHTRDEHVPLAELTAAARIYARMIERLCAADEERRS